MSGTEDLINLIHREVQRVIDRRARDMPCIVDGYDPATFTVKVKLQPSGDVTGWIQIEQAATGAGYGDQAAPNIGDPGWVKFHEADGRAAVFCGAVSNDLFPAVPIEAGERLIKTKWGSTIYLKNDGSVAIADSAEAFVTIASGVITMTDKAGSTAVLDGAGGIGLTPAAGTVTVNGNLAVTQTFNVQNINGVTHPCNVTGSIVLTGSINATGDVVGEGHSLANHIHEAPNGATGPPIG